MVRRRFVLAGIDVTDEDDPALTGVRDKYKVVGLPTILLVDARGHEASRFTEFLPAERLVAALAAVK
jgi:thioredoxin:protein disulfide reductase